MRKFTLYTNKAGTSYSKLNGESGVWFTENNGLGLTVNPNTAELGDGFRRLVNATLPKNTITGTLSFKGSSAADTYSKYSVFALALSINAETLYLGYNPTGSTEYRCRVALNYITKGELSSEHLLNCPVSFVQLTPWYTTVSNKQTATASISSILDLIYNVAPFGTIPNALELKLTGLSFDSLLIEFTDSNGQNLGGECLIFESFVTSDELAFSSKKEDCYIRKNGIDIIDKADITLEPFIRLPYNASGAKLHLHSDIASGSMSLEYELFRYFGTI